MLTVPVGESGASLRYETLAGAPKGAVVVCPGGGYSFVSPREARPVAEAFAQAGWQPFILDYSVGSGLGTVPLLQLARAIGMVRTELAPGVSPVAVCGFSAGAHLAASLGVHGQNMELFPLAEERQLHRPDLLILSYPVIAAGGFRHVDSFHRLVRSEKEMEFFSLEKHVTKHTPPTFLWHTAADETVPVENSLLFASALKKAGIPFEMHIYPFGPHGLSLATPEVAEPENGRYADPHVAGWFSLCLAWLDTMKEHMNEQ